MTTTDINTTPVALLLATDDENVLLRWFGAAVPKGARPIGVITADQGVHLAGSALSAAEQTQLDAFRLRVLNELPADVRMPDESFESCADRTSGAPAAVVAEMLSSVSSDDVEKTDEGFQALVMAATLLSWQQMPTELAAGQTLSTLRQAISDGQLRRMPLLRATLLLRQFGLDLTDAERNAAFVQVGPAVKAALFIDTDQDTQAAWMLALGKYTGRF